MNPDELHLRLLSIFHYIVAGLTALFASFFLFHLGIGIAVVTGSLPTQPGQQEMDPAFGWFFIFIGALAIVVGWTTAILIAIAGRKLAARRGFTYCLVIAGIECLFMPFGTVLGVFTIVVLMRPSVKALFDPPAAAPVG
jgi:hypothetical protein